MFSKVIYLLVIAASLDGMFGYARQISTQYTIHHDGHSKQIQEANHGHVHDFAPYHHAKYSFGYEVHDPHTGDIKSQEEHGDGGSVKGHYSLHQPDGYIRYVEYHADKHSGFHANVKYEKMHHGPHQ